MPNKYIVKSKDLLRNIAKKILKANVMVDNYNRLSKTPAMPSNAFINFATSMYMMGCYQEAEDILQNAICFPTRTSNALINLGIIKQTTGDYEEAIKLYLSAYKKDNHNSKALNLWGNCLAMMGKPDEAISKYEHAIKINDEDSDVYLSWGALLIKMKKYKEAKEKLELAIKCNCKDARPVYMLAITEIETGELDSALERLKFVIHSTENNFEALHNVAYIFFRKKDYENAIKYAKKSLAIYRHKVETYLLLGDIYALLNKEEESLQFYEMAEMNDLKTFFLYMSWAVSLQKFNHHAEAVEKLNKANDCLKVKKVDEVYARLAFSYLRTDEIELAIKNKDIALELNPNNYMANSVSAEIEIQKNNYSEALKLLEKCKEDFENKAKNYMFMALCYQHLGNIDSAKSYYEKSIEYNIEYTDAYINYGNLLLDSGDYELAKKKLKQISEKTENISLLNIYFKSLYNLAKQNSYKYNVERAIEIAEKIEAINNELFVFHDEKEELKGLLRNYE